MVTDFHLTQLAEFQPDGQAPISSMDRQISPDAESGVVYSKPRRLRTEEIAGIVDHFRRAERNAIETGFNSVPCGSPEIINDPRDLLSPQPARL